MTHLGIGLSPHYDELSTACYEAPLYDRQEWPNQSRLPWPLLGVDCFGAVNRNLLLEAGRVLHLSRATALRLLDAQHRKIGSSAEAVLAQIEAENALLAAKRPELALLLTAELRCQRGIFFVVIREMLRRLQ